MKNILQEEKINNDEKEVSPTPSPIYEKSTRGSAFDGSSEDDSPTHLDGFTRRQIVQLVIIAVVAFLLPVLLLPTPF